MKPRPQSTILFWCGLVMAICGAALLAMQIEDLADSPVSTDPLVLAVCGALQVCCGAFLVVLQRKNST